MSDFFISSFHLLFQMELQSINHNIILMRSIFYIIHSFPHSFIKIRLVWSIFASTARLVLCLEWSQMKRTVFWKIKSVFGCKSVSDECICICIFNVYLNRNHLNILAARCELNWNCVTERKQYFLIQICSNVQICRHIFDLAYYESRQLFNLP